LYYTTLKLAFFTSQPILANNYLGLAVLLAVLSSNFYFAWVKKDQTLSIINLALAFFTALVANESALTLGLLTLTAGLAVHLMIRQDWPAIGLAGLCGAYLTHLLWLLNNPILGQPLQRPDAHQMNLIYLVLYAAAFGVAETWRRHPDRETFFSIVFTLSNALGVCLIGGLNVLFFFRSSVSLLAAGTFVFFLTLAIWHWQKRQAAYANSFYSSFAHLALSIAIIFQFRHPDYFVWLSLQSLLVMITALWFRSRIIVLANIAIFTILFCYYVPFVTSHGYINLSLAITSLTSARILNWKRRRLELKTDMIRNLYLVFAFIIILYGLNEAVPRHFVSLAWLAAALFYFAVSWILQNIKYRRMAMLTILATVLHVLIIDLSKLSGGLRILSFIIVGLALVCLSIVFARHQRRSVNDSPRSRTDEQDSSKKQNR